MEAPATPASTDTGPHASRAEAAALLRIARGFDAFLAWADRFARHRAAAVIAVTGFSVILRLGAGLVLPHPRAYVPDEFAYLLGGETLACGRAANPQHPLWAFYESPHILVHPVYASKYPPAQAAFIAIGAKLFHDPAAGVLLSVALFAGAMCWALQAYVPAAWALLGGFFVALACGPGHYWMESFWGGAATAFGAALVIGAFQRITKWHASGYGWVFGLGMLILLNSRPYEGGALTACFGVLILIYAIRERRFRVLVPLAVSFAVTLGLMGYYDWRVTGHVSQMPYALYQAQYGPAPTLWILPAKLASSYGRPELQRLFVHYLGELNNELAWPLPKRLGVLAVRLTVVLGWGVGAAALLPLIFLPAVRRHADVRLLALSAAVVAAFLLLDVSMFLHYAAPLVALLLVLSFLVLFRMTCTQNRNGAVAIAALILLLMFGSAAARIGQALSGENVNYPARPPFRLDRDSIQQRVAREPGQHVILVRYASNHDANIEWVYNGPDIDGAPVIWAHDLGEARNRELLSYYPQRHFWLLEPDHAQPVLATYRR